MGRRASGDDDLWPCDRASIARKSFAAKNEVAGSQRLKFGGGLLQEAGRGKEPRPTEQRHSYRPQKGVYFLPDFLVLFLLELAAFLVPLLAELLVALLEAPVFFVAMVITSFLFRK